MTLHLVIHRPEAPPGSEGAAHVRAALIEAIWEVAESHWVAGEEAVLVSTDLSAPYLLSHFRHGLVRRGHPDAGLLMVVPVQEDAAWSGLPDDAEGWLRNALG